MKTTNIRYSTYSEASAFFIYITVHISHAQLCVHPQQFSVFLLCLCLSLLWCFHLLWLHPHSHPLWPVRLLLRAACFSMGTLAHGVFSQSESNTGTFTHSVWFVRSRCEHTLVWTKTASLKEEWDPNSAQLQEVSQTCYRLWAGIFIYLQAG